MNRILPIIALSVIASAVLINQISCGSPQPTAPTAGNVSTPMNSPAPAAVNSQTPAPTETPEELVATSAAASSHCGDKPPANPSNCSANKPFNAGCALPFTGGVSHDIDKRCPNEGCATKEPDKAQNRIKNNLCASGTPVKINLTSIDKLQAAVDNLVQQGQLTYGNGGPPADRAKLQGLSTVDASGHAIKLGEGKLVTLDAFVLDAKHDDTFPFGYKGETVNCKNSLLEWNDIHVALGQTASEQECSSVTAEIIPHFRPAVWERFDSNSCTSPHVTKPLPVKGIRVRITGQLFFDGSHKPSPCSGSSGGGNPLRRSVWEIHPAYKIEVFDGGKFISLEQWASKH
jgi:hypothetical protein